MRTYDAIVVGSGAGGATVARELSKRGKEVLVLERGHPETSVGTFLDALRYYDGNKVTRVPRHSKEGVALYHAYMAGGTTVVAIGNFVRCLEKELREFGIELSAEFEEAEKEIGVAPIDDRLLSDGSRVIVDAADQLGYHFSKMPKGIDPEKCQRCSMCAFGCKFGAKWTALRYLEEAASNGADIKYGATVSKVIVDHGQAVGVEAETGGHLEVYRSSVVVLSAGALETPIILTRSGIANAGTHLFTDTLVKTYAVDIGHNLLHEPQMSMVDLEFHESKGFMLSPYADNSRELRVIEAGVRGFALPTSNTIGIMTKITDENIGCVHPDGTISKAVTASDQRKITEGVSVATEILIRAGAKPESVVTTKPSGAHQGGTAGIGRVVDSDLRTKIDNLFVCDASVLPTAPGLPPILTIIALSKRLAKFIAA